MPTSNPPKRRSKSPPKRRSKSPPKRRSKSPPKRRSKSPPKRRSKSPPKRRSKSPPKRRSKSPPKRRKRVYRGILVRDKVRSLIETFDSLYNDVHFFVTEYAPFRLSVDPIKAEWEARNLRAVGSLPYVPPLPPPNDPNAPIKVLVKNIEQQVKKIKQEIGDDTTSDVRTLISLEKMKNEADKLADMKEEGQTILQSIQKMQQIFITTFFNSDYRSQESQKNNYKSSLERMKKDIDSIRLKVKETEQRNRRDFDVELPSSDDEDFWNNPARRAFSRRVVDFVEPPPPSPPKRGFFDFINPQNFRATTHD